MVPMLVGSLLHGPSLRSFWLFLLRVDRSPCWLCDCFGNGFKSDGGNDGDCDGTGTGDEEDEDSQKKITVIDCHLGSVALSEWLCIM